MEVFPLLIACYLRACAESTYPKQSMEQKLHKRGEGRHYLSHPRAFCIIAFHWFQSPPKTHPPFSPQGHPEDDTVIGSSIVKAILNHTCNTSSLYDLVLGLDGVWAEPNSPCNVRNVWHGKCYLRIYRQVC